MADLDTRSKRASSMQAYAPFIVAPPLPDGSIGAADRQHAAWSFSGILAGVTVPLVLPPFWFDAADVYTPGAAECESFAAGPAAVEVYVSGASDVGAGT